MALLCVRLGFWQLARLGDRRSANARVEMRLDSAVTSFEALPRDTALARFRRVTMRGEYDHEGEFVLIGRSRNGSPGVYLFTPLRLAGGGTGVMVNRGWVYAPDAMTIERERWREPGVVTVNGFVQTFHPGEEGTSVAVGRERAVRRTDHAVFAAGVEYPIAAVYVVATGDEDADRMVAGARGAIPDSTPARLSPPPLDDGSHLGYAFQWFTFASIALGGAGVVWWQERGRRANARRVGRVAASH